MMKRRGQDRDWRLPHELKSPLKEKDMAIVNCPSCGKPVSDKAENCVHCGISLAQESTAPAEEQAEANAATTEEKQIDYMEQFHSDEPNMKSKKDKLDNLFKFYDRFEWLFFAVLVGATALAIYLMETNDFFASYGGGVLILICIFASMAIGTILKFVKGEILPYLYSVACSKWLIKNNIDATQYIKDKYLVYDANADSDGIAEDLYDFAQGVVFASDAMGYAKVKAHVIIRSIVTMIFALWIAFVVPFVLPSAIAAVNLQSDDVSLMLVVVVPVLALLLLRIVLFLAMTIPDRRRVSNRYAPKQPN
ncbi:MAG: hypothetical protein K2M48_02905 [Clostridiales bacterium]|nr:hypothetical protein [Clostridiales bacterium]